MLRKMEDKLQTALDRIFEAFGYHRHPPPVRLMRIVIVRVPDAEPKPSMSPESMRTRPPTRALVPRTA